MTYGMTGLHRWQDYIIGGLRITLLCIFGQMLAGCEPYGLPHLDENQAAVRDHGHVDKADGRLFWLFFSTTVDCAGAGTSTRPGAVQSLNCSLRLTSSDGVSVNFELHLSPQLLDGEARTLHAGEDFRVGNIEYRKFHTTAGTGSATETSEQRHELPGDELGGDDSLVLTIGGRAKQDGEPDARLDGYLGIAEQDFALGFNKAWVKLP